ncbi:Cellulose synthase catalytic subunit [Rhodopirellula islandica]|uniref:Cellulose synthase catalytic subunit n=1 Tax=Rhodopirellula islandica TaxID=595434 RepID=A0A0J1B8E3_RHOIS|nr:glycosyltransferase [Rhodopirellula islandica]KLU02992.1 Cellulose synthase catalytic subunit [Rhodopirellula islandica]
MFGSSNRFIRRTSIIAAMLVSVVYLGFRGAFTLNFDSVYATSASLSLYVAELYGCLLMHLYFFQIWEIVEPEPVAPLKNRTVDVYIPTYNEDPSLLRGTISAALALHYEHETYVLDDGNRPAVAELCDELGATYINRDTNLHAKAGNLNHAMGITAGEFVVIFDADHISRQDFITRLLGYFEDDRLGFVQTPHSFYNFDNFHGTLDYGRQTYWEEGEIFYNVIQPGKNYWNGVSFCGSAAMFRRTALEDVGCVATETITEDMHTGLRLHAKGWNSLFVNERLVSGQAATDVTTFNTQRLRWGEGNLGIFAHDNPFTMPGLTFAQRLCYLGSMLSWTTGIQKLQLYLAPMLMLLTGVAPVAELSWTLGIITLIYMLTIWTAVTVTSNGHGNLIGTELTHMASFWTQIQSCYRAVFKRKKTTFVVTSKRGRQTNSIRRFIMPQCLYIVGSALAIAWASTKYSIGLTHDLTGVLVGSFLLLSQCWFAWQVIQRSLRASDETEEIWRHPCALHMTYQIGEEDDRRVGTAVTCDLNEVGVGFHAFEDLPIDQDIDLTISAMGLTATCRARLCQKSQGLQSQSSRDGNATSYRYGCEFVEPSTEALGVIWRLCSDYATTRMYDQFESRKKHRDDSIEVQLATSEMDDERINLPISLSDGSTKYEPTVTEGITAHGCMVLATNCPDIGTETRFVLTTPLGRIAGTTVVTEIHQVKLGCVPLQLAKLDFVGFTGEGRSLLLSLCNASDQNRVSAVVKLQPPERQLPRVRPAILTGTLSIAASLIAIFGTLVWNQDDILLNFNQQATVVPQETRVKLASLLAKTVADPDADEQRIVRLREIFQNLGDRQSIGKLDQLIMDRDVTTFTAKFCRAQTFDGAEMYDRALPIYADLLEHVEEASDDQERNELFISAGRNHANRGDVARAVALFSRVDPLVVKDDPKLRREHAGLLAKVGRIEEAISFLTEDDDSEPSYEDRLHRAHLYASARHFDQVIEHCHALLTIDSEDPAVLKLLANAALGRDDFELAMSTMDRLVQLRPDDSEARRLHALTCLWNHDGERAMRLIEPILVANPNDAELQRSFVEASLLVDQLSPSQSAQLQRVALAISEGPNAGVAGQTMVAAMARHNQTESLIPFLTQMVEERPHEIKLRLQLVDLLESAGDFRSAEKHLNWLLTATTASL